ncbi:MAG: hypothetical protein RIR26_1642 [Pseudomonadota bacterium]
MNKQSTLSAGRTKGGLILYGFSIASGLANFAALKGLHHLVPNAEIYSQLSILLLSFTTFQILTDFGTHAQFLKNYSDAPSEVKPAWRMFLLQCRLALGGLAFVVSYFYALSAHFSSDLTLAFLIYQFCFIPFAVMSTADSCFLASGDFAKAILSRLARLLGLIAFMASVWLTKGENLKIAASAFTLSFVIFAGMAWNAVFRKASPDAPIFFVFRALKWKSVGVDVPEFIRGSTIAGLFIALQVTHSFVGQSFMVRSVGETNLSDFNTSTAVTTPAILAFQTLVQMQLPSVTVWIREKNSNVQREFLRFALRLLALAAVMLCGLWLAHTTGGMAWFFPLGHEGVLPLSQLQTSLHALLNLAAPLMLLGQYRGKGRAILKWMTFAIFFSWGLQAALNSWSPQRAFLIGHAALALLLLAGSLMILDLHKRSQDAV